MVQVARNVTMEEWGFLAPGQYLIHDRDGKYCPAFQQHHRHGRGQAGATAAAVAESQRLRGALGTSVKEECLSRLILFGEASLRHALRSMWSIIITREIIRERATSCSFLRSRQTKSVQARFSVVNGSGGS